MSARAPTAPQSRPSGVAADLVVPADGLPLDVGDDPEDVVEVQRQVEFVVGVGPPRSEDVPLVFEIGSYGHEREDVRVVHLARRVRVRVVDARCAGSR